ncbi:hypothetical protein [Bacillus fonticola]|nr:hypothetical protein [Bacillus fonticola]
MGAAGLTPPKGLMDNLDDLMDKFSDLMENSGGLMDKLKSFDG